MSTLPKQNSGAQQPDCPQSPPPPSVHTSTPQSGQRKSKLARRARSFKEDFLDKIVNMRSTNNLRSQSPNSRPKSNGDTGNDAQQQLTQQQANLNNDPLSELDEYVKHVQLALKYFRDVIAKDKLEQLPGSGTVVLENVANIVASLKNCILDDQSSSLISATSQLHQCVARLIKLCDDVVLYGSPALGRENVSQLVQSVQDAINNLISLSREKLEQKLGSDKRHSLADSGRSSLPEISLTPKERNMLNSMPKNFKQSLSSESILNSQSDASVNEVKAPPKPPLPIRHENSAPPLPPKRRHRTVTAPHSRNVSPNKVPSPSDIMTSVERLNISPAHSLGGMIEDNASLLSTSNAGSLDSVLNPQNDDSDFELRNISPIMSYTSRRESAEVDSPSLLSQTDFGDPTPSSLCSCTFPMEDSRFQSSSFRTSSSSYMSQHSSVSYISGELTSSSSIEHSYTQETFLSSDLPPALPVKTRVKGQQMVTSMSHQTISSNKSPTDSTPPPLPMKKRHILAYIELFEQPKENSTFNDNNHLFLRHSVHAYSAMQREWDKANSEIFMNTTHSCHFSMNATNWPPLERVGPRTNLTLASPTEPPPALPPKLGKSRRSVSPPPPIYVALSPPIYVPPSPVTPTPCPMPLSPPIATSVIEQPIYDFGLDVPPPMPRTTTVTSTIPTVVTPMALTPMAEIPLQLELEEEENTPLDLLDVTKFLVLKKLDEEGFEIKGGHVDALIVQATKANKNADGNGEDFLYQEAFITTYRTFISPYELCQKLQKRYEKFAHPVKDSVRQRAARNSFSLLVRVVSDLTISDLTDDLLKLLMNLVHNFLCCGDLNLAKALRCKILEKCENKRKTLSQQPPPLLTSFCVHTRPSSLLDFKSEQIAEQMTLLDAELFMKIEIPEVLIWAQEQNEETSPNLTRFTEHFNKMSYWARSRILEQKDAKDRERYVVKFIKVMRHLRRANNFNSYLALLSALDSAPIRRLEWHRQITEGLKEYCALIDSSSSFRAYRLALAETQPPCIPYIGLVLQDLTFVHIGNPAFLDKSNNDKHSNDTKDNLINFSKRWQQFNIVENMKRFKKCQYGFKKHERILELFNNFDDFLCEESMWQISEQIKPRGGTSKK